MKFNWLQKLQTIEARYTAEAKRLSAAGNITGAAIQSIKLDAVESAINELIKLEASDKEISLENLD